MKFLARWWPVLAAGALILFATGLVTLSLSIQSTAHETARAAQRSFPGDEVEALLRLVESEAEPLDARNHAVWALGQLGDPRALPVLRRHDTGGPCDHGRFICQDELRKAIDGCSGRTKSLPRFIVRWVGGSRTAAR
jgi:hypothetical protein